MKDIRVNSSWNQETEVSVIKVPFGKVRGQAVKHLRNIPY